MITLRCSKEIAQKICKTQPYPHPSRSFILIELSDEASALPLEDAMWLLDPQLAHVYK